MSKLRWYVLSVSTAWLVAWGRLSAADVGASAEIGASADGGTSVESQDDRSPAQAPEPGKAVPLQSNDGLTAGTTVPAVEPDEDGAIPPRERLAAFREVWADAAYRGGWRIQQHVVDLHYRLLDDTQRTRAEGTLAECRRALNLAEQEERVVNDTREAVILVHGLLRTGRAMRTLKSRLEQDGYQVYAFEYPSTRIGIEQAADYLHRVVASLSEAPKIHFVGHSLGGLIARAALAENASPQMGRLIMIGSPNQGADLADRLKNFAGFRLVCGPAGQQLCSGNDGYLTTLGAPTVEFGIIAGGRGTERGFNPLVPGDDDGTVSVESTRLEGAADFIVLPHLHMVLCRSADCLDCTSRFLKTGKFRVTAGAPEAAAAD